MKSSLELNSTEQKYIESRKYPRFQVDLGTLIEFELQTDYSTSLYFSKALVINSSVGGCGIITVNKNLKLLKENNICYLRIPEENYISIKARIIWVKEIDKNVFRLGLEYID